MDSQRRSALPFPADSHQYPQPPLAATNAALYDTNRYPEPPLAAANAALYDSDRYPEPPLAAANTALYDTNRYPQPPLSAANAALYDVTATASEILEEINSAQFDSYSSMNSVNETYPNYFGYSDYNVNPLESDFNRLNLSPQPHPSDSIVPPHVYNSTLALPPPMFWGNHSSNINLNSPNSRFELSVEDIQRLRIQLAAQFQFNRHGYNYPLNFARDNTNSHHRSALTNRSNSDLALIRYSNSFHSQSRYPRNYLSSSVERMRGGIFSIAKEQSGCRFFQEKLKEGNPQEIEIVFWELKDHTCELMKHQFGNYIMQELFKVCNEDQISELLLLAVEDDRIFKEICTDTYGTRAVQKLLDRVTTREQTSLLISVMKRIAVALTKSSNGHHIILHCFRRFSFQDNKHILEPIIEKCIEIATDQAGCCVLQPIIGYSREEPRELFVEEIRMSALFLSEHHYGNFVVQYVVELQETRIIALVRDQLIGNFVSLSMNKFGSNVVEKFLMSFDLDPGMIVPILEEIIYSPNFLRVLQDPYGNFVAQTALDYTKGSPIYYTLLSEIEINQKFLHSHPHGKEVLDVARGKKQRRSRSFSRVFIR